MTYYSISSTAVGVNVRVASITKQSVKTAYCKCSGDRQLLSHSTVYFSFVFAITVPIYNIYEYQ